MKKETTNPAFEKSLVRAENIDAQQELRVYFNAMDEVLFSVDMINNRVIQISPACEKLYGYDPAYFFENHLFWFDLIHPDDRHIVELEDKQLGLGKIVDNRYRIIRKDKAIRWVENKIIPKLDVTGKLVRVDGITRDITDKKIAEEKLKQSEARYRQIVETAQEGIWTIDKYDKTNFVNKKMCDILGYTTEEMMGKELYDFMDKEGKIYALECMERRRKGSKENLDIRYITKSGQDVWCNISANPIFDERGVYSGSLAMVTDITQRKRDEETVKKSEANLLTLFENTDTAYVLFDTNFVIISFNSLAQKYSQEQNNQTLYLNSSVKDYFTAERWPFIKNTLEKVAKGEPIAYEISLSSLDGLVKWYNVRWLNVKDADGKNTGFVLANKEITAAKNAELEREKITADLIQHDKDLEQFTYIISHNLRAPVANILGLAGMLHDHDLDNEAKMEVFDRVAQSIKNIDTVIKDLNQVLQAREMVSEKKETIYFDDIIEAFKASIHDVVLNEKVQFKYNFNEAESIFCIPSYINSVFYNLLSNSIKYRKPGISPIITVKSRKLADKIELRFKDNGKGIDLEKHSRHVFGMYKRFDPSMEGKGLGLFMVKTQIEALGGTIKIKSKPGMGTEFVIQLPG